MADAMTEPQDQEPRDQEPRRYATTCDWEGSTSGGYHDYDRTHCATAPPAAAALTLTADSVFGGSAELLDPEQLLVIAAASCQLLSFLAVAARARVDVVAYHDEAEGVMPTDERPILITRIVLRPEITVRGDTDDECLQHLVEVAHRECFIANSLTTEIIVEPRFTHVS